MEETGRRREIQRRFNEENGITPQTVRRNITDLGLAAAEADWSTVPIAAEEGAEYRPEEVPRITAELEAEMRRAAEALDFEKAARLRDRVQALRDAALGVPRRAPAPGEARLRAARRPQMMRRRRR
jgi:excinuclease ABC subunit B